MHTPLKILQHFSTLTELCLVWSDGKESYLPLKQLRQACPCAKCQGEPDILGRTPEINPLFPQSASSPQYQLSKIEYRGGYSICLSWKDGHNTGLYTYQLLRSL